MRQLIQLLAEVKKHNKEQWVPSLQGSHCFLLLSKAIFRYAPNYRFVSSEVRFHFKRGGS